jgi:hypothetical protein
MIGNACHDFTMTMLEGYYGTSISMVFDPFTAGGVA